MRLTKIFLQPIKTRFQASAKLLALIAVILCQACSSEFVAKTLYNNLGNIYADGVSDYAKFDKDQQQIIQQAGDDFAKWHRTTQLVQYQSAVQEFSQMLDADISSVQIRGLGDQMEIFGAELTEFGWPKLVPVFLTITVEQAEQIEVKLAEELEEWQKDSQKRYAGGSTADPHKRNLKEVRKMFRRALGVKLSAQQVKQFEPLFEQSQAFEMAAMELEQAWNSEFVALLKQKGEENKTRPNSGTGAAEILAHIRVGQRLLRDAYPAEIEANIMLFSQQLAAVLNSLDEDQRNKMQRRLLRYEQLLGALIEDR